MTTTVYALAGWEQSPSGHSRTRVRHYYATEQDALAALPDLVLSGRLATPVKIEPVEVHGALNVAALDADRTETHNRLVALGRVVVELKAERYTLRETLDALRSDVRKALGRWHADAGRVPDVALAEYVADAVRAAERADAGVDAEQERRRARVIEAALAFTGARPGAFGSQGLRDAVDALREYTPAEIVAPAADGERAAAARSVRGELHTLAPLPWRQVQGRDVRDAEARHLFMVSAADQTPDTDRIMGLLVELVNGPDGERAAARHEAERAVLDAARAWLGTGLTGPRTTRLIAAVEALAVTESGVA